MIDAATDMEIDSKSPVSDEFLYCHEKLDGTEVEVELVASVFSLHALNGSQGNNTMTLSAMIG